MDHAALPNRRAMLLACRKVGDYAGDSNDNFPQRMMVSGNSDYSQHAYSPSMYRTVQTSPVGLLHVAPSLCRAESRAPVRKAYANNQPIDN
jgi:hypothetical protein